MTAICFFFSLVWFYLLGVGGGGKSRASLGVQAVNTESVYLSCVRCCSFGFSKTQNGPGDGSPASGMTGALQVESQKKRSLFSVGFHAEAAPNWALLGRRGLAGSLRTHGGHILWECDFKKTRAAIQRETFVVPNLTHTVRRENSKKAFFFPLVLFWKEHGERRITQGRAAPPHWRVIVGRRTIRQQDNRFRSDKGGAEQWGTDRWTMRLLAVLLELLCIP